MVLPSEENFVILLAFSIILFVCMFALGKKFPAKYQPIALPPEIFKKNRKDFLIGSSIGGILSICVNIPLILDLIGNSGVPIFEVIIQSFAAMLFLSFALILIGMRIYSTLIQNKDYEKRKYVTDGILTAFLIIEFLLFFSGYLSVFIPPIFG